MRAWSLGPTAAGRSAIGERLGRSNAAFKELLKQLVDAPTGEASETVKALPAPRAAPEDDSEDEPSAPLSLTLALE